MSRKLHSRRSPRPSSSNSSSSSSTSSSTSSRTRATSPDFHSIQRLIRAVFRSSRIAVHQVERLPGSLHQVYLAKLADGGSLVLKCPPATNIRILRHEKHLFETEQKTLETLHEYTQLPIPHIIKHDAQGGTLGSPFLLMSYVPGVRLSKLATHLTHHERSTIDRTLGSYVRTLTTLSATQFGMTHRVFARKGCSTWREVFLALLEAALRDAEDMLVTIPYDSVRYYVSTNSHFLDDVTQPRLVALNACEPDNVLVDEHTKEITGLVGFSNVIWGDSLMSGGIADGSDAFFEGLGERPTGVGSVRARLAMYATYRAVVQIVTHHYRTNQGVDELAARRGLACALNQLAGI